MALKFQTVSNAEVEIGLLRTMAQRRVTNVVPVRGFFDARCGGINLRILMFTCGVIIWMVSSLSCVIL